MELEYSYHISFTITFVFFMLILDDCGLVPAPEFVVGVCAIWQQSALEEFVASSREPARARAGQALHWQYVLHDIPALALGRNRKRRLTVPTLLLTGAADPIVTPKLVQGGDGYASDLRIRTVPGCGHLLPEERPDLVASTARELFRAT